MMIWIVKQLISNGFCIQIIKGQKCTKPAIVAGGLFQTRVLPLYHDCTVQSYFTRFWSSNVRDYPLAVEWCHEINEFADDYVEIIYAKSENGCGELYSTNEHFFTCSTTVSTNLRQTHKYEIRLQ